MVIQQIGTIGHLIQGGVFGYKQLGGWTLDVTHVRGVGGTRSLWDGRVIKFRTLYIKDTRQQGTKKYGSLGAGPERNTLRVTERFNGASKRAKWPNTSLAH